MVIRSVALAALQSSWQKLAITSRNLARVCNVFHALTISRCSCGFDFCYLCGKEWMGPHGCPHYGQATFDAEGFNQDGFHRETGLNREGLTRRQETARRRGEDPDEEEEDEGEEDDDEWEVMQHLTPEQRQNINLLHGQERDDALDSLRIQFFEERGILFGADPPPPPLDHLDPMHSGEDVVQMLIMTQIQARFRAIDDDPVVRALFARLLGGNPDAPTATQIIHRIAELQAESIGPLLAVHALPILALAGPAGALIPDLDEEQTAQFIQHLTHHLTILAAQAPAAADDEDPDDGEDEGDDSAPENDENVDANDHDVDSDVPEFDTDEAASREASLARDNFLAGSVFGPQFDNAMPDLHDPEISEAELTAEAARLHHQIHQVGTTNEQEPREEPRPGLITYDPVVDDLD
jgi:hypothetical protein